MHLDALNHPIKVGDQVITNALIFKGVKVGTVQKLAGKTIRVSFPNRKKDSYLYPAELLVVSEQIRHNKNTYPEHFV